MSHDSGIHWLYAEEYNIGLKQTVIKTLVQIDMICDL